MPLTPCLGREPDLARILAILDDGPTRLLTLTGPGGVGKTRLALEAAATIGSDYADGVQFIALAALRDPDDVPAAISRVCGVPPRGTRPLLETIRDVLRTRHLLLVLDNYEHLLAADTSWLGSLIGACPRLTVLVTSRIALGIPGRAPLPRSTAACPGPHSTGDAAISLFVRSAQAARADFVLGDANRDAVVELCRRLDGLPLAIELAASRLSVLTPAEMVARIDARFSFLNSSQRAAAPRLRSLRDTIDWSYDLLAPDEQRLYRCLSVFVDGFTLDAAEAVCGCCLSSPGEIVNGLVSLVGKSFVQPVDASTAEPRYRMLETIREYGIERLAVLGEEPDARNRHAQWCLDVVNRTRADRDSLQRVLAIDRLEADHANLVSALDWLDRIGDSESLIQLVNGLESFWNFGGHEVEGLRWYTRVLDQAGDWSAPMLLDAVTNAAILAHSVDDPRADELVEHGLALAERSGTTMQRAMATFIVALRAEDLGAYERAAQYFQISREWSVKQGDAWETITCDYHRGIVAWGAGDRSRAIGLLQGARDEATALGDPFIPAWCLVYLALIACDGGDLDTATALLRQHPPLDILGYRSICLRSGQPLPSLPACVESTRLPLACSGPSRTTSRSDFPKR